LLSGKEPSVTYRLLHEVEGRPAQDPEVRKAARAIPREGWGAAILRGQLDEGQWDSPGTSGRDLYLPKYIATNWRLLVLADLGLDRRHRGVARAAELLMQRESGPKGGLGRSGSEVCFTGNAVRMMVRFGYGEDPRVLQALDWLVRHQKADGGWHCFRSRSGTLDGWEAMAAFAALPAGLRSKKVDSAIEKGAEFYLDRGLLREGKRAYDPWSRLHFPAHYYYDVLVGLDMLTALGYGDDPRLGPPLDLLESKRNADGSWNIDASHPDLPSSEPYQPRLPIYPFVLEYPGRPSRWLTLTALVCLQRAGRA
jgi:hypothetical protein